MEKVIAVLMSADRDEYWCQRQRGFVAEAILGLGVAGLAVNVLDTAVRHSLMTLTTLDPPVAAVVSMWTQQCYGDQIAAALRLLEVECDHLAALTRDGEALLAADAELHVVGRQHDRLASHDHRDGLARLECGGRGGPVEGGQGGP